MVTSPFLLASQIVRQPAHCKSGPPSAEVLTDGADLHTMRSRYAIVLGQGRSGTNWVVDSLDVSPVTFCRNEPDMCTASVMSRLPSKWRIGAEGAALSENWDAAATKSAQLMGERDHRLNHPKVFVSPLSQRLGVAQLSARPKARELGSRVIRSWKRGEWAMPPWVGDLEDGDVTAVFKIVQAYNWAIWVLENRPDIPVVHVVRHPGGRHESFLRRYVAHADAEETRFLKIEQLRQIVSEGEYADRQHGDDGVDPGAHEVALDRCLGELLRLLECLVDSRHGGPRYRSGNVANQCEAGGLSPLRSPVCPI